MKIITTNHAKERMARRNITYAQVIEALNKSKEFELNGNGTYARAFVTGESHYQLHVGFEYRSGQLFIMTVLWKGKND